MENKVQFSALWGECYFQWVWWYCVRGDRMDRWWSHNMMGRAWGSELDYLTEGLWGPRMCSGLGNPRRISSGLCKILQPEGPPGACPYSSPRHEATGARVCACALWGEWRHVCRDEARQDTLPSTEEKRSPTAWNASMGWACSVTVAAWQQLRDQCSSARTLLPNYRRFCSCASRLPHPLHVSINFNLKKKTIQYKTKNATWMIYHQYKQEEKWGEL